MNDRFGGLSGDRPSGNVFKSADFSVLVFDSDGQVTEQYYLLYDPNDMQIRIARKLVFPDFGKE